MDSLGSAKRKHGSLAEESLDAAVHLLQDAVAAISRPMDPLLTVSTVGSSSHGEDLDTAGNQSSRVQLNDQPSLNETNVSKRQKTANNPLSQRTTEPVELSGNIPANPQRKGTVRRTISGDLEWWSEQETIWRPAVYHQTIRTRLIEEAAARGSYDHPRAAGDHLEDITSYLPEQQSWSSGREHLPDIVLQIAPESRTYPTHNILLWYDHERIVLNADNHPVRNFRDIPDTVSSEIEGGIITAVRRLDPRITVYDFLSRMPHDRKVRRRGQSDFVAKKQYTLHGLRMRAKKFADSKACLTWMPYKGADREHDYLMSLLPQSCKDHNSVRDFRDLTKEEIKEMRHGNSSPVTDMAKDEGGLSSPGSIQSKKDGEELSARKSRTINRSMTPSPQHGKNKEFSHNADQQASDFDNFMKGLPNPADLMLDSTILAEYGPQNIGTSLPEISSQHFDQAFEEIANASTQNVAQVTTTNDHNRGYTEQSDKKPLEPTSDPFFAGLRHLPTTSIPGEHNTPNDTKALESDLDHSQQEGAQQPYHGITFDPKVALDAAILFEFANLPNVDDVPDVPFDEWTWD